MVWFVPCGARRLLLPSCLRHRGASARSRPVAASIPSHPLADAAKATEAHGCPMNNVGHDGGGMIITRPSFPSFRVTDVNRRHGRSSAESIPSPIGAPEPPRPQPPGFPMKNVGNDDLGGCVLIVAQAFLPVVCMWIKDTGKNACATDQGHGQECPCSVSCQPGSSFSRRPSVLAQSGISRIP